MRGPFFAIVLALGAAAGCSRREPPPPAPKEAPRVETLSGALGADAASVVAAPRALAGKTVLHIGDSMVGGTFGLTRALEAKLTGAGARIVRHTTVSETLQSFDRSPTLRDLLRTHDPDIVIVNLGANDATVPFPAGLAHHVANIAKRASAKECWWIGPPSWKGPDTGLVTVLRENVGACRFFDSSGLELDRASDGIHPNDRGAAVWANAFWDVFVNAPAVRPF